MNSTFQQKTRMSWRQGLHAMTHLKNGDKYVGEWKDDKMHGQGVYYFTRSNSVYEGQFSNDKPNGYGVLSVPIKPPKQTEQVDIFGDAVSPENGSKFQKNFDPLPSNKLKKVYAGEWKDGQRNGYGSCFFSDGSVYEGQWQHDVRQGWGKMAFGNGQVYEGEWHADMRHGQGVLACENGDRYEGTFMRDAKEGPGRFIYIKKRQMYEGEWVADVAKCGTLVQFPNSNPTHQFPYIELKDYKQVIDEAVSELQNDRETRVINA